MYFTSFLAFLSNVFFTRWRWETILLYQKPTFFRFVCEGIKPFWLYFICVWNMEPDIVWKHFMSSRQILVLCGWNITNIMYKIMKLPFSYEGHFFHQDRFMLVKLSKPPFTFTFTFKALSGPVTPSFQLINFQKWVETQTWITKYSTNKEECRGDTRLR